MVVEAAIVIEDKNSSSNASVLQQLVVVLLEKTQNLEYIQDTYERDMDVMRQKVNDHEKTIRYLLGQIEALSARIGYSAKSELLVQSSEADVGGLATEEPISPGLSSSLQDVFNQLEFLNDKSIKLESISSCSDEKHSLYEDDLAR